MWTLYLFFQLIMVDKSTRWLEAIPMKNIEANSCTAVFLSTWIAPDLVFLWW
jgi:hypothetical protein